MKLEGRSSRGGAGDCRKSDFTGIFSHGGAEDTKATEEGEGLRSKYQVFWVSNKVILISNSPYFPFSSIFLRALCERCASVRTSHIFLQIPEARRKQGGAHEI